MDQAIIMILRDGKPNMSSLNGLDIRKNQLNIEISSLIASMQTQPEQKKRMTAIQIDKMRNELNSINNKVKSVNTSLDNYNKNILPKTNAYIKTVFYDKPEYSSYFTEEKKNELITRSNNMNEIIQIESFQDVTMAPVVYMSHIGIM